MIFTNLSKCLLRENFIDGEVWIVEKHLPKLRYILNSGKDDSTSNGSFIELVEANFGKPTYIPTNEFFYPFQQIVNTYGVPRYQEINPAFFNIVTFPFLFGIMFGDIGHGLLLIIFAWYLCLKSEQIKKGRSSLKYVIKLRHLLLLLGVFSFFCGLMYNDFLAFPIPLFGTCYQNNPNEQSSSAQKMANCIYPIGIDPKWYVAKNELAFINSLKMKLSVLIGVCQMTFGILLKGLNEFYFYSPIGIIFEFLPQLIFMSALFGYLIVMIFLKWSTDWAMASLKAPSLIQQMMNIFLKMGSVDGTPLWGDNFGVQQEKFHLILLILCLALIPLMLIPKPLIIYFKKKQHHSSGDPTGFGILAEEPYDGNSNSHVYFSQFHKPASSDHSDDFVELLVHQAIETIEFILGTVSNTASYLRLWALSLAHSELSKVFFEKTLMTPISEGNFSYGLGLIKIFLGFFVFANLTFFVLMCMDFMECFLHTLRLHWVEFQNKFFKADGYLFNPYSFKYLIEYEE